MLTHLDIKVRIEGIEQLHSFERGTMKDFLDQEITAGDTIVYPNRQGSRMWMVKAEVLVVNEEFKRLSVRRTDGITKTLTRVDRVTVVQPVLEPAVA